MSVRKLVDLVHAKNYPDHIRQRMRIENVDVSHIFEATSKHEIEPEEAAELFLIGQGSSAPWHRIMCFIGLHRFMPLDLAFRRKNVCIGPAEEMCIDCGETHWPEP